MLDNTDSTLFVMQAAKQEGADQTSLESSQQALRLSL